MKIEEAQITIELFNEISKQNTASIELFDFYFYHSTDATINSYFTEIEEHLNAISDACMFAKKRLEEVND